MKDVQEILRAYEEAKRRGKPAVLATIVNASGSTYRRPGARMLITKEGETIRLLSGGCLEGDLAERARAVLETGEPQTIVYDMTSQEDLVWGLGLGCAGMVHVLLERLPDADAQAHLSFLEDCLDNRRHGVLATVFASSEPEQVKVGRRLMLDPTGNVSGSLGDDDLDDAVLADVREIAEKGVTCVRSYPRQGGSADVLIESVEPPLPLVIFGGGPDAVPMVRFAKDLGWHVTIVDHRPAFAKKKRFPEADAVILAEPQEVSEKLVLDSRSVVLVMTHKFLHDVELVKHLLPFPVRYLGLLGPKARSEQLLADLKKQGIEPDEEQRRRLYGPVGLDIGAETPEEIALSALSEIQAALTGRQGGSLRDRQAPLHDRPE